MNFGKQFYIYMKLTPNFLFFLLWRWRRRRLSRWYEIFENDDWIIAASNRIDHWIHQKQSINLLVMLCSTELLYVYQSNYSSNRTKNNWIKVWNYVSKKNNKHESLHIEQLGLFGVSSFTWHWYIKYSHQRNCGFDLMCKEK